MGAGLGGGSSNAATTLIVVESTLAMWLRSPKLSLNLVYSSEQMYRYLCMVIMHGQKALVNS